MSRSSDDGNGAADRAAVEPVAALIAVLAVGAALGLYVTALDGAAPEPDGRASAAALDRIERDLTVGGIVRPERLETLADGRTPTTVELATKRRTWRVGVGGADPIEGELGRRRATAVADRPVTVAVAPGETVRGVLRVAVHR